VRDLEFLKSQPVGVRHVGDGVVIAAPSDEARRVRRYVLQAGSQAIAWPYWKEVTDQDSGEIKRRSEFRIAVCCREPVDGSVKVYRNETAVGYSGLMRCGNVWGCVICATKVLRRRAEQIKALFDVVHKAGGSAVMVTFTSGHSLGDKLVDLLARQKLALRRLQQWTGLRCLVRDRSGHVVATEVTYSQAAGWHPHSHQAWFWPTGAASDPEYLASKLFPLWEKACTGVGLKTVEKSKGKRIGVDVVPAWDASQYLTKFGREREWDLAAEITAGRIKASRGKSLTPWAILEEAILLGKDSAASARWIEYLRATKGFHCVSLRGSRDLLLENNLPTNYDDWKDANDAGEGESIGLVGASSFYGVVQAGGLGRLLEAARAGGLSALDAELNLVSQPI